MSAKKRKPVSPDFDMQSILISPARSPSIERSAADIRDIAVNGSPFYKLCAQRAIIFLQQSKGLTISRESSTPALKGRPKDENLATALLAYEFAIDHNDALRAIAYGNVPTDKNEADTVIEKFWPSTSSDSQLLQSKRASLKVALNRKRNQGS